MGGRISPTRFDLASRIFEDESSLVAKGSHRINAHGAARGNVTRERSYANEKQGHARVGQRIKRAGVNQQAAKSFLAQMSASGTFRNDSGHWANERDRRSRPDVLTGSN